MSQVFTPPKSFDPLDMRNYTLEKLPEMKGGMWADRILRSALAEQLVRSGMATVDDLNDIAAAWREWAAAPDGWLTIPHGEILCRV